jgi:hypothetical protein
MMTPGLEAMIAQLGPVVQRILQSVAPLVEQPVVRVPYSMSLSETQVIPAGESVLLTPTDFQYSFEWPLEVHEVGFSQDPSHTYRDWRILFSDQIFNRPLEKAQTGSSPATLVDLNTGKWCWKFPWVVRPKGGAFSCLVTNLDQINPISVDISFIGYQLIPRGP